MKSSGNSSTKKISSESRPGKVFVEKSEILEELIDSIDFHLSQRNTQAASNSQSFSKKAKESPKDHTKILKEQQMQRTMQTEAIMQQNIQKSLERANEKQERLFPMLMGNLDRATSFLDLIEKDINLHDETHKNKVRRQFEDWNTGVHGNIQVNYCFFVLFISLIWQSIIFPIIFFFCRKRSPIQSTVWMQKN
jgi:hypothetical protein